MDQTTPQEHQEGCACGHDHHHHHHHHGHGEGHGHPQYEGGIEGLTQAETDMLRLISRFGCLPVARFSLRSSKDSSLDMTAMEPVTIDIQDDGADTVRARGDVLLSLEDKGLISLDYDIPVSGYDYAGYRDSLLFGQLEQAAKEAAQRPDFLFDIPVFEGGSMALTDMGEMIID